MNNARRLSDGRGIAAAGDPPHDAARDAPFRLLREIGRMSRRWLLLVALLIGVVVVAADDFLFSVLTGRPLSFASDVEPVNALVVAIPYLVLALAGARRVPPWAVGLALTLSLWGYGLYDGVSYQWHPDGSGADIGLGLIMLASPVFITAAVLAVHFVQRRGFAPA